MDPNRPPQDPNAPKRPPLDPNAPNRPPPDPNAPNRPPPDPNAPNRPPPDPNAPNRPPPDPNAPNRPPSDPNAPERSAPDQSVPYRSAPDRSAPERSAPDRNAPERSAPYGSAPDRDAPDRNVPEPSAPDRNVPERSAPDHSAPYRPALDRDAPDRDDPNRSAPDHSAPYRPAPDRDAPDRNAPERSVPDHSAPYQSAPDRAAPDRSAPDRDSPERSAPDRSAAERFAPGHSAPYRSAPDRDSPERSAPDRSAPEQFPPGRSAPDRSAPDRSTPDHSAPYRSAPDRDSPERSAPDRSAPERFPPGRSAPDRSAPERTHRRDRHRDPDEGRYGRDRSDQPVRRPTHKVPKRLPPPGTPGPSQDPGMVFDQPSVSWAKCVYNRDTGEIFYRTPKSWVYILCYSTIYLLFLITFTLVILYVSLIIIKETVDFNSFNDGNIKPQYEFLKYSGPGIGLTASPTSEDNVPLIWYKNGEKEGYDKYVKAIDKFLWSTRRKREVSSLGPCGQFPYGYGEKPCIIIRINKKFNWAGKPLNFNSTILKSAPAEVQAWMRADSTKLWLQCNGFHSYDKEHIGRIKYYPDPPGFDASMFPLDVHKQSPLVAVQISEFTIGISLAIECKLWYDAGPSTFEFMLYVAPEDKIAVKSVNA